MRAGFTNNQYQNREGAQNSSSSRASTLPSNQGLTQTNCHAWMFEHAVNMQAGPGCNPPSTILQFS